MAKKPTISTVSSGYSSQTTLNNNFTSIQSAFDNTLSLDGSTPNAMLADLDMNNQDIINADNIACNVLTINGTPVGSIDVSTIFGDASYQYTEPLSVMRTINDRLQDRHSVADWGSLGDGTSEQTELQNAATDVKSLWFPPGSYLATSLTLQPGTVFEGDPEATLSFTFDAPFRKGNRFTYGGDYEPTLGQLGHPAPNKGNSWQNALQVTRGTDTTPDSTTLYARTAAYIEMHTSKVHSAAQSSWGNSFKTPALTVETQAHTTFEGEANGAAFRAYSTDVPASATAGEKNLVGVSAIGQTNTGSGIASWSVWGANFVAAQTSGNAPDNCVGIEVDVVHTTGATAATGPSSGNNYTGYWAQADGDGVFSTAAFYASRSARSSGWNYFFHSATRARDWSVYVDNTETATTTASGVYAKIASSSGKCMELVSGADTQLLVNADPVNPVFVRVNSTLKALQVGAVDSGGAGYRLVRVTN